MSKALRYNEGKPKLGYFARSFPTMLEAIARIKEFGAAKYDDGNWRKGNKPDDEYLDSMTRHLDKFLAGEEHDKDSGCHHLGHAVWNLCALLELNRAKVSAVDEGVFREQMAHWAAKRAERDSHSELDIGPDGDPEYRKAQGTPYEYGKFDEGTAKILEEACEALEGKLRMEVNGETVAERVVPINTEGTNEMLDVNFGEPAPEPEPRLYLSGVPLFEAPESGFNPHGPEWDGFTLSPSLFNEFLRSISAPLDDGAERDRHDAADFDRDGFYTDLMAPPSVQPGRRFEIVRWPVVYDTGVNEVVHTQNDTGVNEVIDTQEDTKAPVVFHITDDERDENFQKLAHAWVLQGMFKEAVADLMGETESGSEVFEERTGKYFSHSAETCHRDAWGLEI